MYVFTLIASVCVYVYMCMYISVYVCVLTDGSDFSLIKPNTF